MGITRVADITGLDSIGIPVCLCVRPNSKSLSVSQGKGIELAHAKVSSAMESIEAYHAENIDLEMITDSYNNLARKENIINPETLNLLDSFYYHGDVSIPWVAGFDLIQNKDVLVPFDLVHCIYISDPTVKPRYFFLSSNGLASGNNILEAISHGICEVVERDSTSLIHWKISNGEDIPDSLYIDPATIDSPVCKNLLEILRTAGISILIRNETSEIGIPSLSCMITEQGTKGYPTMLGGYFAGYGCHTSREIALVRAILEAVQARLTFISGARDDLLRSEYLSLSSLPEQEKNHDYFRSVRPSGSFTDIPSISTDTLEGDISAMIECLRDHDFSNAVVVDLTRREIGITVVRVIIPGMGVRLSSLRSIVRSKYRDRLFSVRS